MTRNQITQRVKEIAENHKQIRTFSLGDVVDSLESDNSLSYPVCFVDINSGSISKLEKRTLYTVEIWLCDLVNVNEGAKNNESEVFSDLTSIAEDLFAQFHDPDYSDTWDVATEISLEYFKEKFTDMVGAVKMTVALGSPFLTDRCQVPVIT
jgi:hypothetical protein